MTTQEPSRSPARLPQEIAEITGAETLLAPSVPLSAAPPVPMSAPPPVPVDESLDDSQPLGTAQTIAAPSLGRSVLTQKTTGARTTVLPRVEGNGAEIRLIPETKNRYEPVKLLGAGGMGEVLLVQDQDIARHVAIKRLLPDVDDPARLARFVDEIRTVGRLEHPNIVPIHDVGVDDDGRYFFVMKYAEGETLESIIRKLALGDPDYRRKYTIEARVELFINILNALSYAHSRGVVHRDVKPANVMVGRFGEVMLMDWGIAKPIAEVRDLAAGADASIVEDRADKRGRMFATRVGSLIGTPAYMAPEQARGDNHQIDQRADLYAAAVLFHELVTLHHYLENKETAEAMIDAVIREDFTFERLLELHRAMGVQCARELVYFIGRGLSKDPANRFQSAEEMIALLHTIIEGRMDIHCHATLTKRVLRESARLVDRRPRLVLGVISGLLATSVFTVVELIRLAIG